MCYCVVPPSLAMATTQHPVYMSTSRLRMTLVRRFVWRGTLGSDGAQGEDLVRRRGVQGKLHGNEGWPVMAWFQSQSTTELLFISAASSDLLPIFDGACSHQYFEQQIRLVGGEGHTSGDRVVAGAIFSGVSFFCFEHAESVGNGCCCALEGVDRPWRQQGSRCFTRRSGLRVT